MEFEIGEIAISVSFMHGVEECEIIAVPGHGIYGFDDKGYIIDTPLNRGVISEVNKEGFWWVNGAQLRKKKPKEEPATWQEIQEEFGWSPIKEKVAL